MPHEGVRVTKLLYILMPVAIYNSNFEKILLNGTEGYFSVLKASTEGSISAI
jgi:hypothetical protein